MTIISRRDAKAAGLSQYFTGKPCPKGHVAPRVVSNYWCVKCRCAAFKRWVQATPERKLGFNRYRRKWQRATPSRRQANNRARHLRATSTLEGRLVRQLRARLAQAVRNNAKGGSAVRDLGCGIAEFRDYIATKFTPGMSWDNWGDWHLDHIRPLASFDLSDRGQVLIACHYTNYQPLWAIDNRLKGARLV